MSIDPSCFLKFISQSHFQDQKQLYNYCFLSYLVSLEGVGFLAKKNGVLIKITTELAQMEFN